MRDSPNAFTVTMSALLRAGRIEEARERCRLLEGNPASEVDAELWRAVLAQRDGHAAEAQRHLKQALVGTTGDPARVGAAMRLFLEQVGESALSVIEGALAGDSSREASYALGIAYKSTGRLERAALAFEEVLQWAPGFAEAANQLGLLRVRWGRTEEAHSLFERAAEDPRQVAALVNLGNLHRSQNEYREAERTYRRALARRADFVPALLGVAAALADQGRALDAITVLRDALARLPDDASLLKGMALLQVATGGKEETIFWLELALEHQPRDFELLARLAEGYGEDGRSRESAHIWERALQEQPDNAAVLVNLGIAWWDCGELDLASSSFERALERDPAFDKALLNLGSIQYESGDLGRGCDLLERYVAKASQNATSFYLHGHVCAGRGDLEQALEYYRRAIRVAPDHAKAHAAAGMCLLRLGRYEEGLQEYEHRWEGLKLDAGVRRPASKLPVWRGEPVDPGTGIVVHAEQGLGDHLQFSRFYPLLAERFARVRVQTPAPLLRLFRENLASRIEIVDKDDPLEETGFDRHCPMMTLALLFGVRADCVPAAGGYLRADPDRQRFWRERLGTLPMPRIGLVWAGRPELVADRRRSVVLRTLLPLLKSPGIGWVSLQAGAAATQLHEFRHLVHDPMSQVQDFSDSAAIVANLDLVIAVDTALAHLSGALGRPTWLLNRFDSDWRWLQGRRDSPWYSSMRVFAQTRSGDWHAVIQQVRQALEYARGRGWTSAGFLPKA